MPTVIVVDTSSSMNIPLGKGVETFTPLQFAYSGLHSLLDSVAASSKLEFVALVSYSKQFDIISPFTRDFDSLKVKLMQLNLSETFELKSALDGLESFVLEEWGSGVPCNVIIVAQDSYAIEACGLPIYLFPGNIIICNLGPELIRPEYIPSIEHYNYKCELYQPDHPISLVSVQQMFLSIAERYYSTWTGHLVCGNFNSRITLSPNPEPHYAASDFDSATYTVESVIEICGFIELQHLGSPGAISRHLVLPYAPPSVFPLMNRNIGHSMPITHSPDSDDDSQDEGQVPSFCVLLHGALKVGNMAALCCVGNDWYGVLFSWADSKKKSNLMLSLLEPGSTEAVPWLGDLNKLTIATSPQDEGFPIKNPEKKSYTQNCVAWIRQQGLQSDIQKILRHSRKLPEKTQQFYKELNRVRRAAIGLGFMSLIEGLAAVLERECTLLPGTAHPACALQLTHAAGVLREPHSRDHKYNILPMKTSFRPEAGFELF